MKALFLSKTQRQSALAAGFAIVIMAIAAVIANDVTIQSLIVENNASETLSNILSSPTKFNVGVLSWIIVLICDSIAAWGLYTFFATVNKNLSLLAAWLRLVYVAMLAVSLLNLIDVQIIIHQLDPLSANLSTQTDKDVMFYLDAFDAMWAVSLIVFGSHILLVGYLALKSEYIPKIFGILLMIAFIGYTFPKFSNVLFPQFRDIMRTIEAIFLIPMLGEVALGVWLMVIGFKRKYKIIN